MNIDTKRWTIVFRALANENRILIIDMLSGDRRINVSDIARELKISFKATSNHLAILKNLGILQSHDVAGHVFYSLKPDLPRDFRIAIKLFLK